MKSGLDHYIYVGSFLLMISYTRNFVFPVKLSLGSWCGAFSWNGEIVADVHNSKACNNGMRVKCAIGVVVVFFFLCLFVLMNENLKGSAVSTIAESKLLLL